MNDLKSHSLKANITPRQHKISEKDGDQRKSNFVKVYPHSGDFIVLHKPLGLSLPRHEDLKSLLVSSSTRLTNRYLITQVIQCHIDSRWPGSGATRWYNVAKPFVWHRSEGVGSVVGSGEGDQPRVNSVDEVES